jgi:tRNA A-37 threonylcarbamoyl transferase component Bud32
LNDKHFLNLEPFETIQNVRCEHLHTKNDRAEYIEGENLSKWLKGKHFTAKAAIALLLELLPIVEYIHSHQVIHRDITPSNLIRRRRDGKGCIPVL